MKLQDALKKIVTEASIIDFAMITGILGFPIHTKVDYSMQMMGLDNILTSLEKYEKSLGSRFTPSNLLKLVNNK